MSIKLTLSTLDENEFLDLFKEEYVPWLKVGGGRPYAAGILRDYYDMEVSEGLLTADEITEDIHTGLNHEVANRYVGVIAI